MKIRRAAEDYLEAILVLREAHGQVRSVDVAAQLGVTRPSVSVAMKHLREEGWLLTDESGLLLLTQDGERLAARVYERHRVLTDCLVALGVPERTAREDACRLEHDISEESFARLRAYMEKKGGRRHDG